MIQRPASAEPEELATGEEAEVSDETAPFSCTTLGGRAVATGTAGAGGGIAGFDASWATSSAFSRGRLIPLPRGACSPFGSVS